MTDNNNAVTNVQDDYKDTLFLPATEFPMRAGLAEKEPTILDKWEKDGLYEALKTKSKDKTPFILHWGPPFANGHMHIGHALTKVLKDVVVRSRYMLGYHSPMIPGWDCHGLPIEWQIEKEYKAKGKNKDEVPVVQFRRECRDYAAKWIDIQREEMKRLGVMADWDNPYKTMDYRSEALIAAELHKFLMNGLLYRGLRPVMWSTVEKTALAEAEVEYDEHKSTTIYVAFPVVNSPVSDLNGTSVVIWTTTPWTIPGNRAIGFGNELNYAVYTVKTVDEESRAKVGEKYVLSTELAETFMSHIKVTEFEKGAEVKGADLAGTVCAHPMRPLDDYYGFDVNLYHGDFVTTEAGTGFVHIAPGHGEDDYYLGLANGVEIPETVTDDGVYAPSVGLFAGLDIYDTEGKEGKANGAVIKTLAENGKLLGKSSLRHQYPHSWRSKAPIIFRTTAQWFIALDQDGNNLRQKALDAIGKTKWVPAAGEKRIRSMVENRPDWCISRQRAWGVPIAIFVNKETKEVLKDEAVNQRIFDIFAEESADAWYARPASDFLGDGYNPDEYEQVMDIVDVWFESGSTHAFVLEDRKQPWPADLYLEGSDQHRGWFQSSLLEACGTRGQAPFKAVFTHGFVVDEFGKKLSKSKGNGIAPEKIISQSGADILRLWVMGSNFHEDVRVSQEALKLQSDMYRRIRNTLRFLLGNLAGFTADERVDLKADYAKLPELEKLMLNRLYVLGNRVRTGMESYDYSGVYRELHDFCNLDLSAFYFDVRKDRLYLDRPDLFERRACRTVLEEMFRCLTAWFAPLIVFTTEETWQNKPIDVCSDEVVSSVHLREYPVLSEEWNNADLAEKWERIKDIRSVITGAIEVERKEKRLGSSLEAHPVVYLERAEDAALLNNLDMAEICITSQLTVKQEGLPKDSYTLSSIKGVSVVVNKAVGQKCARSWKILPEVGTVEGYPDLSPRDADAVQYLRRKEG